MISALIWASAQSQEQWYAGQRLAAQRAWASQVHRQTLMQQFPFYLPAHDWETALYSDRRAGFTMALPGFPRPLPFSPAPGEPPADALLSLSDLPIGIRFFLGRPTVPDETPDAIVARQLGLYVRDRAGSPRSSSRPPSISAAVGGSSRRRPRRTTSRASMRSAATVKRRRCSTGRAA